MLGKIFLKNKKTKGFSLVEILVILGILIILAGMSLPAFRVFQRNTDLDGNRNKIAESLRLAQSKTLASEGADQYGVHFDALSTPNQYILFKGSSYALRDPSFDKIYSLPLLMEIYEIDLWGGEEIFFERLTGYASSSSPYGKISIRIKEDPPKTASLYMENSGLISFDIPEAVSDSGRITDSRHVHFEYNRNINTAAEKIVLDFSTLTYDIPIADNLTAGQFYWEGEVLVDGSYQEIKIHTHRLNDPDTQFCVHRDGRYNDKPLLIFLDGDNSGSLIEYDALGQEIRGTSVNLTIGEPGDPQRQ